MKTTAKTTALGDDRARHAIRARSIERPEHRRHRASRWGRWMTNDGETQTGIP